MALAVLMAACSAPMPAPPSAPVQSETSSSPNVAPPEETVAPAATPEATVTPAMLSADNAEARAAYENALAALRGGQEKEAEVLFLALAQQHPQFASPHTNLGIIHYRRGQMTEAEQFFKRATELHPQDAVAHNYLGILYRQQGRFAEARHEYQQALAAQPDYANAHLNMGILYELYLGDLQQALVHYRRYRQLAPDAGTQIAAWLADLEQRLKLPRSEERTP